MASSTDPNVNLLSPVAEELRNPWESGPLLSWGLLAAVVFFIHYLLLPGLRGTVSGLSEIINALTLLDALLTQFLFVGGVILSVHLELALLRSRAYWTTKALSVPLTTVLMLLLINAAVDELAVLPLIAASGAAAFLVLATGASEALRGDQRDYMNGAFLVALGLTAAVSLTARSLAWQATLTDSFAHAAWARWFASSAWALSGALTLVALRHLARSCRRPLLPLGLIILLPLLISWLATRPIGYDDPSWQVFASRMMRGLLRGPQPFAPSSLIALEHLVGLGAALWALLHRNIPDRRRIALGLGLLALRAPDMPLLALALMLAALASPLRPDRSPTERLTPG